MRWGQTGRKAVILLGLAGAALATSPVPAGALDRSDQRFTVHQGDKKTQTFPALVGTNPAATPRSPARCRVVTHCDAIPLTVVPPNPTPDDDYFVTVRLEWDTTTAADAVGTVNDLDLFIYQETTADDGTVTAEQVGQSAGVTMPEQAALYRPERGDFVIIVHDTGGANSGYKLTVAYTLDPIDNPYEAIDAPAKGKGGDESAAAPPVDRSGEDVIVAGRVIDPVSGLLVPAPIGTDPDFSGLLAGDDGAVTGSGGLLRRAARRSGPPGPVSGLTVLLWMGALPAAALAAGTWWLRRRHRTTALAGG